MAQSARGQRASSPAIEFRRKRKRPRAVVRASRTRNDPLCRVLCACVSSERQAPALPWSDYFATISALSGAAFVLLSLCLGLTALLHAGMTCFDTCAGAQPPPGADWTQYSEAAQWTAVGVLAGVNMVTALGATALVVLRHRRLAGALLVLFAAASVALNALLGEPFFWLWFLALMLGLVTVVAARQGERAAAPLRQIR